MADLARRSQGLGDRPALLLVNLTRGFTDQDCPLGSQVDGVVGANRLLLDRFRAKGLPVFFTTVVYHNDRQARVFGNRLPACEQIRSPLQGY